MFKYRDLVLVTEGFYEGASGQIQSEIEYQGTDISKIGTKEYVVKVISYIRVSEQDLALIKEKEKEGKKK